MRVALLILLVARVASAALIEFHDLPAPVASDVFAIAATSAAVADMSAAVWPNADVTIDQVVCSSTLAPGGGASWTITVQTAPIASPHTFADAGFSVVISGASQTHNGDSTHAATLHQNESIAFLVHPTGAPNGAAVLKCTLRASNATGQHAAWLHFEGVVSPTSGSITAYGSTASNGTNDYDAYTPTLFLTAANFIVICDGAPGTSTEQQFRLRGALSNVSTTWSNTPINCIMTDPATTCSDTLNTQSFVGVNAASFRLSAITGTPTAHVCRGAVGVQ